MSSFRVNNKSKEEIDRGNSSLAVKAGLWYVVSIFMVKAIAFITTPIFARLMSKADYGEFSNFASWQITLLIITSAELYNTVSRAYYDFKEDFDQYLSTITLASCGITFFVYIFFLISHKFIFNIVSIPPRYIHLMFIVLLSQAVKQIYLARERTLYRYKSVAALSFISLFIPTTIAIMAVFAFPDSDHLALRLYGFFLPTAIIGALCAVPLLGHRRNFNWKHCKYAIVLSIPLLVHYLTTYLLSSTNIIVTKAVLGAEIAAIVSIANSTIHVVTVFFHAVSGALTTWLMDNLDQKQYNKVKKDSLFYVLLLAFCSIGVMMTAPEIVQMLGGHKYLISTILIPGFVFAVFIQSITTLYTIILTYDKNIIKTATFTGVVAVLSIFGKIFVLKLFGYHALPYVNITAFSILFMVNYFLVVKAGYAEAVNFRGIVAIILAMGVFMEGALLLYNYDTLRYNLIVVFLTILSIALYIKRNELIPFVKKIRKSK